MAVVTDSSVAACWALPDEFSEIANRALDLIRASVMIVPPIFWYELRNVLVTNERRNRIERTQTDEAIRYISGLQIKIDDFDNGGYVMALARKHMMTVYDSAYLDLALRWNAGLATLDKKLASAAEKEGVTVVA